MRKSYKLDEIDCANCALKLEDAIRKLEGGQDAKVNFMTQKMTLVADDERFGAVLDDVCALVAKMEPDCEVIR